MIHPDTELRLVNQHIGLGVFATRAIPKGTITWVRDRLDQAFAPAAVAQLPTAYHEIVPEVLLHRRARPLRAVLGSRPVRQPLVQPDVPQRGLRLRASRTGYRTGRGTDRRLRLAEPRVPLRLLVRPAGVSPPHRARRSPRYANDWDRIVADPFRLMPTVSQPLWPFLDEKDPVEAALAGIEPDRVRQRELRGRRDDSVRSPAADPLTLR